MKNLKSGTVKYLVVLIVLVAIIGMIINPLFDLLICKFFTNSDFNYSVVDHIVEPIIFAFIFGIIIWILDNKDKKKSGK